MTESLPRSSNRAERTLDKTVIAAPATRGRRAATFQAWVLGTSVVFIVLAILAQSIGYFPIDLRVTLAVQGIHSDAFHRLMAGLTWLGYMPQVVFLALAVVFVMFLTGLRWEAVMASIAGAGSGAGMLAKQIVFRPRPPIGLVHVARELASPSFPSGHVLVFTSFCGFLAFLTYTLLRPSWFRMALLAVLWTIVGLMGLSRIDLGAHWFSDVVGGYLLGGLWLALTIKLYRWGKPRFFVHQPVASADKEFDSRSTR